jgi:hypothetical protein
MDRGRTIRGRVVAILDLDGSYRISKDEAVGEKPETEVKGE